VVGPPLRARTVWMTEMIGESGGLINLGEGKIPVGYGRNEAETCYMAGQTTVKEVGG